MPLIAKVMQRSNSSQVWWFRLLIPTLGKLKQEDFKFEASMGYTVRWSQREKNKWKNPISPSPSPLLAHI